MPRAAAVGRPLSGGALGCDEDEAAFRTTLRAIARQKPKDGPKLAKAAPKGRASRTFASRQGGPEMVIAFKVHRVSADEAGESRFDAYDVPQSLKDYAPPARPFFMSDVERATGYVVIHLPVGWVGEPHPSPRRQIVFCLSGSLAITASDGDEHSFGAGDAYLLEDTSGKGHKAEVTSEVPVNAAMVQLPASN